ncbi:MAG TPA: hypothetical protein VNO55_31275 [Polyangia bacterium]|nr:hypothetical protein [Polyangia bacterium]
MIIGAVVMALGGGTGCQEGVGAGVGAGVGTGAGDGDGPAVQGALSTGVAPSPNPPAGLAVADVPQFVSVTFDDNFGLADPTSAGGADYVVDTYRTLKNPAGRGNVATFDGTPIASTFYNTSIYISDSDDPMHKNRASWQRALDAGHEMADHTIHHYNGGTAGDPAGDDCCRPRRFSVAEWVDEIKGCKDAMTDQAGGLTGLLPPAVVGFRTPFLSYNDELFSALVDQGFLYDSTVPNCFADGEDGTNCAWPYTLDAGSADAQVLASKFPGLEPIGAHGGLWEMPTTTMIIPPDSVADSYGFTAGLRDRIAALGVLPYPSLYEPATGKLAGLDYTILIDAMLSPEEMLAVLKYTLDLHLQGNRSPLIFIAHSFLYDFTGSDEGKPDDQRDNYTTPSSAVRDARWKAIADFLAYAVSKPEVRVRPVRDIVAWMQQPTALARAGSTAGSSAGAGGCTVAGELSQGGAGSGGMATLALALAAAFAVGRAPRARNRRLRPR